MESGAAREIRRNRLEIPPEIPVQRETRLGRKLQVRATCRLVLLLRRGQVDVEARVDAVRCDGLRLALEFVIGEVMDLVQDDRAAERGAVLLVRVGQYPVLDEVRRVELVTTEVP